MTTRALIERTRQVLESAGYHRQSMPLMIGGLSFKLPDAFVGTEPSADIVLVADTSIERSERILRTVEAIGRALDVGGSKRPITTIIAGPRPDPEIMSALARVSRVLPLGSPSSDDFEPTVRNWLAIFLPLSLPAPRDDISDPLQEVVSNLAELEPSFASLVDAARNGADAVQSRLHALINEALSITERAP